MTDSKSVGLIPRVGSSPTTGTKAKDTLIACLSLWVERPKGRSTLACTQTARSESGRFQGFADGKTLVRRTHSAAQKGRIKSQSALISLLLLSGCDERCWARSRGRPAGGIFQGAPRIFFVNKRQVAADAVSFAAVFSKNGGVETYADGAVYLGLADAARVTMPLNMCNRHGLIARASGTGKTVTMKVMAESFSDAGVPVFLCDVKGDVSGIAERGGGAQSEGMEKRIDKFGLREEFAYKGYPVSFWDIYQEKGYPVRCTVSDMGPDLLSRLLNLSPAQQGVLDIIFKIADDRGLLLLDMKDLRVMLGYAGDHREELAAAYGNILSQSLGGILRSLLLLEREGGDLFLESPRWISGIGSAPAPTGGG